MDEFISKNTAIAIVRAYLIENQVTDGDWHSDGIAKEIRDSTPADVKPVVRGEWIYHPEDVGLMCLGNGIIVQNAAVTTEVMPNDRRSSDYLHTANDTKPRRRG